MAWTLFSASFSGGFSSCDPQKFSYPEGDAPEMRLPALAAAKDSIEFGFEFLCPAFLTVEGGSIAVYKTIF